ncbi:unnamed protein product [Rotaria socialis]
MSFDFLFQISIRNTVLDREKCNFSSDSLCVGIVHTQSICLCVPHNDRISLTNFTCACQDGFSGKRCEYEDVKIDISFYDISIPQSLVVHFITVREHDLESLNPVPIRSRRHYFFMSLPFHLIVVQLNGKFYLTVLQHIYTRSVTIPIKIARSQYYTQCQFSTQQFGLSFGAILGYQIRSNLPISRQSIYVKISVIVASIMLLFGLISGILSILTFQSKPCLKVGCGIYLLASSITSILTIIYLNFKLWFLILSQMSILTSRSFLTFSCISIDFILRFLLGITD